MVAPDYNLKGFHFKIELKNEIIKRLLVRPGDFSGPKDKPNDIALKRLIILFLTPTPMLPSPTAITLATIWQMTCYGPTSG